MLVPSYAPPKPGSDACVRPQPTGSDRSVIDVSIIVCGERIRRGEKKEAGLVSHDDVLRARKRSSERIETALRRRTITAWEKERS